MSLIESIDLIFIENGPVVFESIENKKRNIDVICIIIQGITSIRKFHSDFENNLNGSHTNNDSNKINKFVFSTAAPLIIIRDALGSRGEQV